MRRFCWKSLIAAGLVALTGGSRAAAESLHGLAHQLLAHHEASHHHHHDDARPAPEPHQHPAVDHAEPEHGHHESDQLGAASTLLPPHPITATAIPAWPLVVRRYRLTWPVTTIPRPALTTTTGPPRGPPATVLSRA
ncbi:MAG: hypothetical protein FJ206_00405 [Gemmatimonadetes bacterium]|nr:hypothetical protein [Gemmatimonadota bacterium]